MTRAGAWFSRVEPRRRARAFVLGLLAELPRKNCWTIAGHAGDRTPDGMQHLLSRARWDADGVRDDVRSYVVEELGDPGAVLVVDETGDVKKGRATPGAQRQYTGTAGRIENAQVAVYLGYAAPRGHALIDRELYLPKSWTGDPARCEAAGIPGHVAFATKPQLARLMIERAVRADALAARLPRRAWQRLSAGDGAKGHRWYDWAWVTISNPGPGHQCLLIRRNRSTGELAFYRCYSPQPVTLAALVKVAGLRWTIEENFQAGKSLTGLTWRHLDRSSTVSR